GERKNESHGGKPPRRLDVVCTTPNNRTHTLGLHLLFRKRRARRTARPTYAWLIDVTSRQFHRHGQAMSVVMRTFGNSPLGVLIAPQGKKRARQIENIGRPGRASGLGAAARLRFAATHRLRR